jgi:hypothetical protein
MRRSEPSPSVFFCSLARVFVTVSPFLLADKPGACRLSEVRNAYVNCMQSKTPFDHLIIQSFILSFLKQLDRKIAYLNSIKVYYPLPYYSSELITAVKSFMIQAPESE